MNKNSHIQSELEKSRTKKRDYRLVVDGKYNHKAIMQRAWAYMNVYPSVYTYKSALEASWIDAILKMEDYNYERYIAPYLPSKTLSLKSLYSNPVGDMAMGNATK